MRQGTYLNTGKKNVYFNFKEQRLFSITYFSIMLYKIQNNKCSTELEYNEGCNY